MSSYPYITGNGWSVFDVTLPLDADPVSDTPAAVQQIKKFVADETAGLGTILGSTGQNKTMKTAASNPTPGATESYMFLNTVTGNIYFSSGGTLYPLMPGSGAVTGKVLTSAGANILPTWTSPIPSRGVIECQTAPASGANTAAAVSFTASGSLPTGISISSGKLRIATGYTVIVKGFAMFGSAGTAHACLSTTTADAGSIQMGVGPISTSVLTNCTHTAAFDVYYSNSSGSNVDLSLLFTSNSSFSQATASSTYPCARFIVEVYPN